MADNNTIARPYAQAAFQVAQENNAVTTLSESLAAGALLFEDGQVADFLSRPSLSDEQRLSFLQDIFARTVGKDSVFAGESQHGTNFLKLLLEYDRIAVLPEISAHFETLKAELENKVDAVVTSASKLSQSQIDDIAAALKKRLGCDVNIETKIDENLIGGAVIRAGDVVIDGSLRARLQGLATALVK